MQKISTLIGLIIIVAAAVVLLGGSFAYQYFAIKAFEQLSVKPETQTTGVPTKILPVKKY